MFRKLPSIQNTPCLLALDLSVKGSFDALRSFVTRIVLQSADDDIRMQEFLSAQKSYDSSIFRWVNRFSKKAPVTHTDLDRLFEELSKARFQKYQSCSNLSSYYCFYPLHRRKEITSSVVEEGDASDQALPGLEGAADNNELDVFSSINVLPDLAFFRVLSWLQQKDSLLLRAVSRTLYCKVEAYYKLTDGQVASLHMFSRLHIGLLPVTSLGEIMTNISQMYRRLQNSKQEEFRNWAFNYIEDVLRNKNTIGDIRQLTATGYRSKRENTKQNIFDVEEDER